MDLARILKALDRKKIRYTYYENAPERVSVRDQDGFGGRNYHLELPEQVAALKTLAGIR